MCICPTFPTIIAEETIFFLLYILAFSVADYLTVGVWVYFQAVYSVPVIHMSIFVPILYCFNEHKFLVLSKIFHIMPPSLFFFFRIALAILCLLWFHINLKIICSISVKNVMNKLIGITLNTYIALGSMIILITLILP